MDDGLTGRLRGEGGLLIQKIEGKRGRMVHAHSGWVVPVAYLNGCESALQIG